MKNLLKSFVDWLERVHFQRSPIGSDFEQGVPPIFVMKAEAALEWALATGRPVTLFTSTVSANALLAGLVFRRSGVSIQNIFKADLDDDDFDRLTRCLAQIRRSGLEIVEGEPPAAERGDGSDQRRCRQGPEGRGLSDQPPPRVDGNANHQLP